MIVCFAGSAIPNNFPDASGSTDAITFQVFQRDYYRGVSGHIDSAYWKANTPLVVEFYEDQLLLERAKVFPTDNGTFDYIAATPIVKTQGNYSFRVSYSDHEAVQEFFNSDTSEYPVSPYCELWKFCGGNMPVGNKVYPLDYTIYGHRWTNKTDIITGEVPKVRLDTNGKAIVFDIYAITKGRLVVVPSKTLIQSIEQNSGSGVETELPFEILIDGNTVDKPSIVEGHLFWPEGRKTLHSVVEGDPFWAEEGITRFVAVEFPQGSKQIAIGGTYLRLPEPIVERDYSTSLRFVPAFPTDKSNITAHIPIFYPDLCHSASFEGFQVNQNTIDFEVTHYFSGGPGIGCPEAIWNRIFQANLGQLAEGEYTARLVINGSEALSRRLAVSSGDLEIVSTGRYTDVEDRNHIIGEIRNVGMQPVANVSALISFYDQDNIEIATDYAFPAIDLLAVNQSSGLDYRIMNNDIKYAAFSIKINYYDITEKTPNLGTVIESKRFLQPYGDGFIAGKVTNISDNISSNQTIVVCVLYDSSSTLIIDTIVNYTRPAKIEPGQTAEFVAYSNYHPVDSYYSAKCSAGEETIGARVIPEFGSSYAIILVAMMAPIIVTTAYHWQRRKK